MNEVSIFIGLMLGSANLALYYANGKNAISMFAAGWLFSWAFFNMLEVIS